MKRSSVTVGLLLMMLGAMFWISENQLQAENENPLRLVTQVRLPAAEVQISTRFSLTLRAMDLSVEGNLAAVSVGPLIHLVDFSDIENPTVTTIELDDGDESWDVKLKEGLLYVGLQISGDGKSLLIYDVNEPSEPQLVSSFSSERFAGTHNLFVQGNVVFLATAGAKGTARLGLTPNSIEARAWMVDVSDPQHPQDLGPIVETSGESRIVHVHDITVIDNRAYLGGWDTGFWIIDFENLDVPSTLNYTVVAHHLYEPFLRTNNFPNPSTHNVWPSADGTVLWITDEVVGEGVRAFDISDPDHIQLLGFYTLGSTEVPHNVVVQDNFAYVAHYLSGLRVLELTEDGLVEIAKFETAANQPQGNDFSGAFGVFPMENYVFISDTFGGLFIFEKQGMLKENGAS